MIPQPRTGLNSLRPEFRTNIREFRKFLPERNIRTLCRAKIGPNNQPLTVTEDGPNIGTLSCLERGWAQLIP